MKLKLIAAALLASTSIAAAADMPARTYTKAPVVSPAFNWTGFYVGVHAGYGWGNSKSVATNGTLPFPAGSVTSNDLDGWLAGGQLGYNYQFSPNWLIGIEGDMAGTGIKGSTSGFSTVGGFTKTRFQTSNLDVNWLATVTGRLGYVAGPALLYVKGGVAFGEFSANSRTVNPAAGNALIATSNGGEPEQAGLSAQARSGRSQAIGRRRSNTTTWILAPTPFPRMVYLLVQDRIRRDASTHLHLVKVGLNYRFGPY